MDHKASLEKSFSLTFCAFKLYSLKFVPFLYLEKLQLQI